MQEWNPRKLNTEQDLPLYRVLADCLRESIREGELKCGSRLPSSRELQNAYHLSSSTVEHGVKLLVREGWLLRRPRLGTFVNNPEHRRIVPSKKLRIKVLFSNIGVEGEHWFRGLFFIEQYLREHHAEFLFERQDLTAPTANAQEIMSSCNGVILCGTNPIDLAEVFLEHHFPFILIGSPDRKTQTLKRMDAFLGDDESRIIKAVKALVDMGHRRISVVYAPEDSMYGEDLRNGLSKAAEMFHLKEDLQVYPQKIAGVETGDQVGCQILCQEKRPTAILSSDIMLSIGILHAAGKLGFSIPEDFSILSIGSNLFAEFATPPLTTTGSADGDRILLTCFREMLNRLFDQIHNPNHQCSNLIDRNFSITFRSTLIRNRQDDLHEIESNPKRKDLTV